VALATRWGAAAVVAMMGFSAPAHADPVRQNTTVLHLNQRAERHVPRDRLTIELRLETTGAQARQVQAELNRRMAALLPKAQSVTDVAVETGDYQSYEAGPADPKSKAPPQFHAVETLRLISRDSGAALDLAGRLQDGGMEIGDMRFDVAPETLHAQQQTLTDEALNGLTARARAIAGTLGLRVIQIESLTVGEVTQPGGGIRPMMMARAAAPMPAPVAAAGEGTLLVTIHADIALAPAP
jgi:predicted secreted protein